MCEKFWTLKTRIAVRAWYKGCKGLRNSKFVKNRYRPIDYFIIRCLTATYSSICTMYVRFRSVIN